MTHATVAAGKSLLTPTDHALLLIDFQSQMAFPTHSIDIPNLRNNVALICKAAAGFKVDTIVTTIASTSFAGPVFPEIRESLPGAVLYDRTSMNTWEDASVIAQVNAFGKQRLVMAGLWTSVCIVGPVLSALDQGFEVYVITDACGDVSTEAHERAVERMLQAGARSMTSLQYLLELQRDWARTDTYALTTGIARSHGGGYGLGIEYAKAMFGASEGGH
jgi:nicotinamidase-related amidase